ncbi:hypothetical protein NQZ68_004039 [Dissostichus eleginoides]|nr:hypothetical protein NQZ68_004039 [Dissostichus eleginoides]
MHRKQQQLRLELMEEDSDSFQHTCKAISMPDLQNMCVMPRLPSPSEQSCHSHQSSEYSLSENGSGPLSSHPPPTHSHWLDSQADNRILQQQPLSIQLGQATKHQDKLPTTTLLCTTTATFQSQALPAFMPSQKQERSILTQSLSPTVASAWLLGAVSKPTALLARSTVMSSPIVQGMQAAGHVGQQLPTTKRYQPAHQPYQPVPPPVATMYGSMQAATQIPYQSTYAPALYPAHKLPATQQPVAQHPVVMPQQSSYGPLNWSVAPSPYTQSAVPQQTAYQSLPVLLAQYAYQPAQYQQAIYNQRTNRRSTSRRSTNSRSTNSRSTNSRSTNRAIYNQRTSRRSTSRRSTNRAIYNRRTNCSLAHRLSQPIN